MTAVRSADGRFFVSGINFSKKLDVIIKREYNKTGELSGADSF